MKVSIRTYIWMALIGLPLLLTGCASQQDGPPTRPFDSNNVADAVPKDEARSRGGNKSYTVFRKHYHVLPTSKGYRQRGTASWYGRKWHGRRTANGEVYNMYGMTAAHKHLPLPTYAKVTSLDTGKSIVVRINDRGPFIGNRIIDLSYSAAAKLGVVHRGVANVEVEAIDPSTARKHLAGPSKPKAHAAKPRKVHAVKPGHAVKPEQAAKPAHAAPTKAHAAKPKKAVPGNAKHRQPSSQPPASKASAIQKQQRTIPARPKAARTQQVAT